jgi:hypothetical protein
MQVSKAPARRRKVSERNVDPRGKKEIEINKVENPLIGLPWQSVALSSQPHWSRAAGSE